MEEILIREVIMMIHQWENTQLRQAIQLKINMGYNLTTLKPNFSLMSIRIYQVPIIVE